MPGLRAELSVKNATDSPLADLSEIVSEPVTPLSLTLFDYILSRELPSRETGKYETQTDELNSNSQRLTELEPDEYGVELAEIGGVLCELFSDESEVVSEVFAVDGTLHLTLEVESREELRDICADIEKMYGPVSIEQISTIRSDQELEPVRIDLQTLTDRQHEVLETAYQLGYFDYPREANAEDVADALGITSSTVTEHLNIVQSKFFGEVFQE